MLDVLAFLVFGAFMLYLGRRTAPTPTPPSRPQACDNPGDIIVVRGWRVSLEKMEWASDGGFQAAFVDVETIARRNAVGGV